MSGQLTSLVTVDGRNPAPVEVGSLSHYLQGFSTIETVGLKSWILAAGFRTNHQRRIPLKALSIDAFIHAVGISDSDEHVTETALERRGDGDKTGGFKYFF